MYKKKAIIYYKECGRKVISFLKNFLEFLKHLQKIESNNFISKKIDQFKKERRMLFFKKS